jgi:hypothetical protein
MFLKGWRFIVQGTGGLVLGWRMVCHAMIHGVSLAGWRDKSTGEMVDDRAVSGLSNR